MNENSNTSDEERGRDKEQGWDAEIGDDDDDGGAGPCSSVLLLGFVRESVLFATHYTNTHVRTTFYCL